MAAGDPFYGRVTLDGQGFLVRERSPLKNDLDLDALHADELQTYAGICGEVLAQTHARTDDADAPRDLRDSVEARILSSLRPAVFRDDVRFAAAAARRVVADYKTFRADHALGAFDFIAADG